MYFSKLMGNVKAQRPDVTLGRKTIITGPNQSGKTSHLSAIELALTGKHPGCNSRQPETFIALSREGSLHAELVGEGDLRAVLDVAQDIKGKYQIAHVVEGLPDPEALRDLFTGGGYVSAGPDRMRELMFKRFSVLKGRPKPAVMDETLKGLWAAADSQCKSTDPTDYLTEIRKRLDKMKRDFNAQHRYVTGKIKEAQGFLAEAGAGHELLPQLEAQLVEARAFESLATARDLLATRKGRLSALESSLAGKKAALAAEEEAVQRSKAAQAGKVQRVAALRDQAEKLREGRHDLTTKVSRLGALCDLIEAAQAAGHQGCICCGGGRAPLDWNAKRLKREEELGKSLQESDKIKAEIEEIIAGLGGLLQQHESKITMLKSEIGTIESTIATTQQAISDLEKSLEKTSSYEGPSAAELQSQVNTARDAQNKAQQLEGWLVEADSLKRQSEGAKHLQAATGDLQKNALVALVKSAQEAVNAKLFGFTARYDLDRHTWEVKGSDGLFHDKVTMSGAELTALELALTRVFQEDAPFKIVILDKDRDLGGLSAENFRKLCDSLSEMVDSAEIHQVVVTWINPAEAPEGDWTRIDL